MKTLKHGLDRFLAFVCIVDFIVMVLLTVYQVQKPKQCQRSSDPLLLCMADPSVRNLCVWTA